MSLVCVVTFSSASVNQSSICPQSLCFARKSMPRIHYLHWSGHIIISCAKLQSTDTLRVRIKVGVSLVARWHRILPSRQTVAYMLDPKEAYSGVSSRLVSAPNTMQEGSASDGA